MRKRLAAILAKLALRLWPECPEAHKFYRQIIIDSMITGKAIVRIDPVDYLIDESETITNPDDLQDTE